MLNFSKKLGLIIPLFTLVYTSPAFSSCYSDNLQAHECRYPQGDSWCRRYGKRIYAYSDECLSRYAGNNSTSSSSSNSSNDADTDVSGAIGAAVLLGLAAWLLSDDDSSSDSGSSDSYASNTGYADNRGHYYTLSRNGDVKIGGTIESEGSDRVRVKIKEIDGNWLNPDCAKFDNVMYCVGDYAWVPKHGAQSSGYNVNIR